MNKIKSNTTVFVFNEDGLINDDVSGFVTKFQKGTAFNFSAKSKEDLGEMSPIFQKFSLPDLDFTIYNHGYVMELEGSIKIIIYLLEELDCIVDKEKVYYLSPTQRVENLREYLYPRGAKVYEIAKFLDRLFGNEEYTSAIKN